MINLWKLFYCFWVETLPKMHSHLIHWRHKSNFRNMYAWWQANQAHHPITIVKNSSLTSPLIIIIIIMRGVLFVSCVSCVRVNCLWNAIKVCVALTERAARKTSTIFIVSLECRTKWMRIIIWRRVRERGKQLVAKSFPLSRLRLCHNVWVF